MTLRLSIISLIASISFWNYGIAQNITQSKQLKTTQKFIGAYNRQNYGRMKKTFIPLVRVLPIKKQLKQSFEPHYAKFGGAKIGRVDFLNGNKLTVELVYIKDSTERDQLTFFFNNKGKIKGIWFKETDFLYNKKNESSIKTNDQPNALKIDTLLKKKYHNGFNGNVLVINNGNIIYKNVFGYANFDTKELLNDSSIFELASCSKQFTAMAIMILAEQGKLKYSDTIQKIIPDLPYQNITVENLLTHTSGIPDYMTLMQKHWDKTKFATNDDIVSLLKKHKPKPYHLPNETFEYSNTGYALLSIIIEKVSGLSYAEFLDKEIFQPLGMKHTRVYNTRRWKKETLSNYAYGYVYSDKTKHYVLPDSLPDYNFVKYLDPITGDGTVNSTILDLVKWNQALSESKLVSKTTLNKAFTKYRLKNGSEIPYGYGQQLSYGENKEKVVYHGGSWPGYATHILHFFDKQTTVIVLANKEDENVVKLSDQIVQILLE